MSDALKNQMQAELLRLGYRFKGELMFPPDARRLVVGEIDGINVKWKCTPEQLDAVDGHTLFVEVKS